MALFHIENLSFAYPNRSEKALDNVNLDIQAGEYLVIFGKSGSGKSTLLRQLKPSLTPFGQKEGQVYFEGEKLEACPQSVQSGQIGFVMQNPNSQIVTDKVWHELAFGLENLGVGPGQMRLRVGEMANFFGLDSLFHKEIFTLSGGQKQLLNLAAIMVMQPKVLILDEPTSQLDPIAAVDFLNTVKKINEELGTTIIITEHRLEAVLPQADRVIFMENGKIIADDSPQILGEKLKISHSDMFCALPSPMQIFYGSGDQGKAPLSVKTCRDWLKNALTKSEKEFISHLEKPTEKALSAQIAISIKDLWFRYEKDGADILKNVNLSVPKGAIFCLVGGNGAGKTTLLKAICGINKGYSGKVLINGEPIKKYRQNTNKLALLPQDPTCIFAYDTVLQELTEMVSHLPLPQQTERIAQVCALCQVENLLNYHPFDLSGGEQQRTAIAKLLLSEPEILLLDEPTKGMDSFFKEKFAVLLKELTVQGITLMIVSHDIEFCAKYADLVGMFFDGEILSVQNPEDFFAQNSFYTTAASRISRNIFPKAVTNEQVIALCKANFSISN